MKVYYAHSISIYGKPQEERDICALELLGFEVVNPNGAAHEQGYAIGGMGYFLGIVGQCDLLAFRAHADGSIPAGVMSEIECARANGLPVIELPSATSRRALTIDQTRDYLRECGFR